MTLRFYNGEYRFVLVDTEVHRCTDVVRQMQWRRPSCLASVNFIALIYLGILCFSVVTPKVAAQGTSVAPLASGNITLDTTEMFTVTTFSSTYQFSIDIVKNPSVTENKTNSENCMSEIFQLSGVDVNETFCRWRTDYLKYCFKENVENRSQCVERFLVADAESRGFFARYEKVLDRYECNRFDNYSMWKCEDCRKAYKDWLCATQIPYYDSDDTRIEPCEDFCIRTEARCPYFLPQKHYCGQRTFFCRGPRETARSTSEEMGDDDPRCFTCNFSQEVSSIEEMGCQCDFVVQNSSSSSSGAAVSSLHHMGSTYAVLHALNLYILVMWTITPTIVAGT